MSIISMVLKRIIGLKILLCYLILHTNNCTAQTKLTQSKPSKNALHQATAQTLQSIKNSVSNTTLTVTAYCQCVKCCGPQASGITASGVIPKQGITVAASRRIPFGTVIAIEGLGTRVVQDRLARKYDSRIDVYFNSHQKAKQFGKRTLRVSY